jgi:3-phenylpropionate/trans-cinnamate dioxygenase ferredoxin subunit
MGDFVPVGKKSDFKNLCTTGVKVGEKDLIIANIDGKLTALDGWCTHAAAPLAECDIEENEISCPLHGARFDVTSGAAKTLPAVEPLKTYDVKIDGDTVLVKV